MELYTINQKGFRSNSYILAHAGHAVIIDGSHPVSSYKDILLKHGLSLDFILLTHGHFDHIFEINKLRSIFGAPVFIHENDSEMLCDGMKNAYTLFSYQDLSLSAADKTFSGGEEFHVGNKTIKAFLTAGHTKGSCCFLCENIMFSGDTLFLNGVGRTDLYGGNSEALKESLSLLKSTKNQSDITIYPGHGDAGTLSTALENTVIFKNR